ncbi:MAG: HepT-like ribonuclease domain-containing protein [Thermoleophilia bacterium]
MLPEERDAAYLWDMVEAAKEVRDMTSGVSSSDFLENRVLLRATERGVEIIGEAAAHVSVAFRKTHTDIPWRQIIGQRNIIVHEYGQIDYEMLYQTATNDIPELITTIEPILPALDP